MTFGAAEGAAWAAGTARADRARAPKEATARARMRMCVSRLEKGSRSLLTHEVRFAAGGASCARGGKNGGRTASGRHRGPGADRSACRVRFRRSGRVLRALCRYAYFTSTKSPAALTAGEVEVPTKT
ncbi:hypothetical protein Saso_33970 [Streptomyces asoensis]|uniref:Uncharacterized protein n=1 Tax=Streptomyces asoensis TaxID=249586 RepID=A0ABQ3S142_9ACTN|nr:hypothetical protein GCM10010496_27320 [Streptomyces asoensis]GHI61747.1 hypothetical protein Saso_33970 [Streptomyces asoensis]